MKFLNCRMFGRKKMFILSLAMCSASLSIFAKISLPAIFTDNMVLQQQTDAPIWGKATAKKEVKITTSWDSKTYTVPSDADGKWSVKVQTPAASFTPYKVTISDGKSVELNNVLIGEVWICSGQSNMEMPLDGWLRIMNYKQEVAEANYPYIRILHLKNTTANRPQDDVKLKYGSWKECTPENIPDFSSVGYFFGRNLLQNLKVPIGLINASWGGTIAEAWTSGESLASMPDFKQAVGEISKYSDEELEQQFNQKYTVWEDNVKSSDKGYTGQVAIWAASAFNDASWKTMPVPALWSKGALSGFDGIAWFRKTITIPTKWAGKNLTLSLGQIDDIETTFFNGEKIGSSKNSDIERIYTIPGRLVKAGKTVIAVRVLDTGGDGGIKGDAKKIFLSLSDKQRVELSGDWTYEISAELKTLPTAPRIAGNNPNRPSVLFNALINPLIPFAFKGVLWYQGESNDNRAYQYRELFPLMINDWRKHWKKDFPFYFVQLANFTEVKANPEESNWAELREAQTRTLNLGNTGMAVIIDIGDAKDIHPKNKQEVGRRLALIARAKTYGEKIAYSGPVYNSYKIEGNTFRISFTNTEGGLKAQGDQPLKGFAIAGLDHKFHWAEAKIEGSDVVVFCPEVEFPIAVRYAWASNPICNLYNGAGLPASPFRTDDWLGITYGKK